MNFSKKVFTFHKQCAILMVQRGKTPKYLKTIFDILGSGGIPRLYSTRKEALVRERVKRYEDYDLRKANDGP